MDDKLNGNIEPEEFDDNMDEQTEETEDTEEVANNLESFKEKLKELDDSDIKPGEIARNKSNTTRSYHYNGTSKTSWQTIVNAVMTKIETTPRVRLGAAIMCFFLVIVFSIYVLNDYHVINIGIGKGALLSNVTFDNTKLELFEHTDDGFMCIKSSRVTFYDINGKEITSNEIKSADPFAGSCGQYSFVAARGETSVYVFKDNKLINTLDTQNTIINARICDDGKLLVITTEPGYNTLLTVYDRNFKAIYKWHSSSVYAVDADFSPDGKRVAAAVINDDGLAVSGGVAILDLNKKEPNAVVYDEDTLALSICYAEDNRIMVACDNKLIWYNNKGTALYRATYYDRTLQKIEFTDDGHAVIGLSANIGGTVGSDGLIMVYNSQGKELASTRINNSIDMLDASNGYIAVNEGHNVAVYSFNGKHVSTVVPARDVMDILMIDNGEKLMLASNTNADIYEW